MANASRGPITSTPCAGDTHSMTIRFMPPTIACMAEKVGCLSFWPSRCRLRWAARSWSVYEETALRLGHPRRDIRGPAELRRRARDARRVDRSARAGVRLVALAHFREH